MIMTAKELFNLYADRNNLTKADVVYIGTLIDQAFEEGREFQTRQAKKQKEERLRYMTETTSEYEPS
jgi:hypothetical protein